METRIFLSHYRLLFGIMRGKDILPALRNRRLSLGLMRIQNLFSNVQNGIPLLLPNMVYPTIACIGYTPAASINAK